jgi:cyanophycinase
MIPKGKLCIIGGHEEKDERGESLSVIKNENRTTHFDILGRLISKIPRKRHTIEIIATASSIPREMEKLYLASYKAEGFTQVSILRIDNSKEAASADNIKRIQESHAVFFTGGDQEKLTAILNNTAVMRTIQRKYLLDSNFIVAGTSAGAMSMPQNIITHGVIEEALLEKDLHMGIGFGFIKEVLVDTHFIKRGRFGRLALAVTKNRTCLGIGLGEDTALIITNGNEAECIGSGMVILIDGSGIGATNVEEADDHTPVVVENLKVHILAEGSKYLIAEKRFILPEKK